MRLSMSEILDQASKMNGRKAKIEFLRQHYSPQLHKVLEYAFNPNIKFDLPEGTPPYKPLDSHEGQGMLYTESPKLYIFVEGAHPGLEKMNRDNPNMKPGSRKREYLFIAMLENVDPADAKLLCAVKDKKVPYKGITYKLVKEAFGEYNHG